MASMLATYTQPRCDNLSSGQLSNFNQTSYVSNESVDIYSVALSKDVYRAECVRNERRKMS